MAIITGTAADDVLIGTATSDQMRGGAGDDLIYGGRGVDTAIFSGSRLDYEIIRTQSRVSVRDLKSSDGDEGFDIVSGVEYFQFADTTVTWGVDPNIPPELGLPGVEDQAWRNGAAASYQVPPTAFVDPDNNPLTFAATLADGGALPGWLSFDPSTRTLAGTPPVDQIGVSIDLRVTVSDGKAEMSDTLSISVVDGAGPPIVGTAGDDVLSGTIFDEPMSGLAGNDVLIGSVGADQLDGGADQDRVDYGASNAAVSVDLASGIGQGGHAEGDTFVDVEDVTGSAFADHLVGSSLSNLIDGGAGADILGGGAGNDIYIASADDTIVEAAGEGVDEVRTASAAFALAADVENLTGTGSNGQDLVGNDLDNMISGGGGNDVLDGAGGSDTLQGGLGDDRYIVDGSDILVEEGDAGTDEVRTALSSYTLADNVENVTGTGPGDQILTGNAGDNVIDGGLGADQMAGLGGNDIYVVDNAGDVVTEAPGAGIDEVRTALGSRAGGDPLYVLPTDVENFTGTLATGQGVRLSAGDNVASLGAGDDLVVANDGGNDRIGGGGGNDFIYFGGAFTSADAVDGGAGFDTVGLVGSYTIAFQADDLVSIEKLAAYSSGDAAAPNAYSLTMTNANVAAGQQMMVVAQSLLANETFAFNGAAETGGRFNIRGGGGTDTIETGAGADRIWGNIGADSLTGGAGKDLFEYRAANESTAGARDTILDFAMGDQIFLNPIDADGDAGGNQDFRFIGAAAFSGSAGELRANAAVGTPNGWLVEGDVNGDGVADLSILVVATPGYQIGAADFWL